MPRSRIIRMSIFVLMLGVGLWCVLVFPSFSQDPDGIRPPAGLRSGNPSPLGLGLPGATPAGALPPGASIGPPAGGPPAGIQETGDAFGDPLSSANSLAVDFLQDGQSGGVAPPVAGAAADGPPMMGMMGGGMGMPGMGPGLTQSQIEEIKLARHAKMLLSRYSHEQKAESKEKIKSELRAVLHQQFRLQHQRRDAELTKIEKRLADLRSRLKKRGDAQSTIVDRRLEQLVSDVDGLGWSAEEIPDNLFNEGGMGLMMPGMGPMGGAGSMMPPGFAPPTGGLGTAPAGGGGTGSVSAPEAGEVPRALEPDSLTPPKEGSSDLPAVPGLPGTPVPSTEPSTPGNPAGTPPMTIPGTGASTADPAELPKESVPRSN